MGTLLRQRHPQLGFINPAGFMPPAKETTLMRPLSDWVLRYTMAQLAQWNARNIPLRLAINVSTSGMEGSSFLEEVAGLAKTYDIDPSTLELGFTESVLIRDAPAVGSVLPRARKFGMGIAMDDLDTDCSNWTYLHGLPAIAIKFDQLLTRDLTDSPKARSVTQAMIGLTNQLGYRMVAEGIKTHDTFHLLRARDCHEGQSYLVAQPILPE